MEKIFAIYNELHNAGVKCFPWDLREQKAVVIQSNDAYALFIDPNAIGTVAEETIVVGHEAGHIATGTTHYINSPYDLIERHEYRANKWMINRLLPRDELYRAYRDGYTEAWEISEYVSLPESFVRMAMEYYHEEDLAV